MGNTHHWTAEEKAKKERSDAIDEQIEKDRERFQKECKVLLLGTSESGKSTIMKQIKIIHQNGYQREELISFRSIVYNNLIESAQAIVLHMRRSELKPHKEENHANADLIANYEMPLDDPDFRLSPEIAQAIHQLCQDSVLERVLEDAYESHFYLMDSATYFFNAVLRIGEPEYVPTEADVLRALSRKKTTGIVEAVYSLNEIPIRMLRMGTDHRSQRRKWIPCFECVKSIIFCTSLSEYNESLLDDIGGERTVESLLLFESIVNSRWFLQTPVILLLTKYDVFQQKILKLPLKRYFQDYIGGSDIKKAAMYIVSRFIQRRRKGSTIYPFLVQATDTDNVRQALETIKMAVNEKALKEAEII